MAKDKASGLPDKQEKFCQEYLITLNATKAATKAGYSENTAGSQGERLLKNVDIQNRLTELRKPLAEKVGITQEMVLNELAKIGFANIQDYFNGDLSPTDLMKVDESKARAISSIKKTVFTSEAGETETIEFKLHDKIKSLELIGKHLGFFETDNKQKKDETITAPVINVYQSGPKLAGSEDKIDG